MAKSFSVNEKKIGKSFMGAIMFGVVPLSMGVLGFIAAGSGFVAQDKGIVNFELIQHLFPAWATIPFLFMLVSGLLSTVDSNLCAAASLTTNLKVTAEMDDKKKNEAIQGNHDTLVGLWNHGCEHSGLECYSHVPHIWHSEGYNIASYCIYLMQGKTYRTGHFSGCERSLIDWSSCICIRNT